MGNLWKLETEADCEEGCTAGHLRIGRHRAVRGSASVGLAYVHYWCVDLPARWPPSPHRQTRRMRHFAAETGVRSNWAGKDFICPNRFTLALLLLSSLGVRGI